MSERVFETNTSCPDRGQPQAGKGGRRAHLGLVAPGHYDQI